MNPSFQSIFIPFAAFFAIDFLGRFVSKHNAKFSAKSFAFEFWTIITGRLCHFIVSSFVDPMFARRSSVSPILIKTS
jgi:hypothetical protein